MKSIDRYYTPEAIARRMVSYARYEQRYNIADFAAGNGELLKAAVERWVDCSIIATDVCSKTVRKLKYQQRKWQVGKCDFLSADSRNKSKILIEAKGKISLILLNPPFSCRGASTYSVNVNGIDVQCSKALAFVLNSLQYLTSRGHIISVLPVSCISSNKDKLAWEHLRSMGEVQVLEANGHKTFADCSAKTVIVRFTKKNHPVPENIEPTIRVYPKNCIDVNLIRGKVQMQHFVNISTGDVIPFIHSTELEYTGINVNRYHTINNEKSVKGPAVLLHRVGKPNIQKVHVYNGNSPIGISDCVIALICRKHSHAKKLKLAMVRNWWKLEEKYNGTCARYITLEKLSQVLEELGFSVTIGES